MNQYVLERGDVYDKLEFLRDNLMGSGDEQPVLEIPPPLPMWTPSDSSSGAFATEMPAVFAEMQRFSLEPPRVDPPLCEMNSAVSGTTVCFFEPPLERSGSPAPLRPRSDDPASLALRPRPTAVASPVEMLRPRPEVRVSESQGPGIDNGQYVRPPRGQSLKWIYGRFGKVQSQTKVSMLACLLLIHRLTRVRRPPLKVLMREFSEVLKGVAKVVLRLRLRQDGFYDQSLRPS